MDHGQFHVPDAVVLGNPASLAMQVALVGYRNKLKGRECRTVFSLPVKLPESVEAFPNEIMDERSPAFGVGAEKISEDRHGFWQLFFW
jgi:hypothetical protein